MPQRRRHLRRHLHPARFRPLVGGSHRRDDRDDRRQHARPNVLLADIAQRRFARQSRHGECARRFGAISFDYFSLICRR